MDIFNYGENLRTIRQLKEISQYAMAANLHISQPTYSRIESLHTMHNMELNCKIAKVLDVAPSELIPEKSDMDTIQFFFGAIVAHKTKEIIDSQLGLMVLVASFAFLVSMAYEAASGFCAGLEASEATTVVVKWTAALGTIIFLYLWIKRAKKRDRKTTFWRKCSA